MISRRQDVFQPAITTILICENRKLNLKVKVYLLLLLFTIKSELSLTKFNKAPIKSPKANNPK
jgi:hypothetical protein